MAAAVGIGPTSELLESSVLPLNDTAVFISCRSVPTVKRLSALSAEPLAGKVNYDITTSNLTGWRSSSELHSQINHPRRQNES